MAQMGVPQIEIASLFNLHPSTVSGMLRNAEAKELLTGIAAAEETARIAAE